MPGSSAFDHNESFFLTIVQIMRSFDVPPFVCLPFPTDYGGIKGQIQVLSMVWKKFNTAYHKSVVYF